MHIRKINIGNIFAIGLSYESIQLNVDGQENWMLCLRSARYSISTYVSLFPSSSLIPCVGYIESKTVPSLRKIVPSIHQAAAFRFLSLLMDPIFAL